MPTAEFPGMTGWSLVHFVWALAWAGGLLVAVAGYGGAMLRGFGARRPGFGLAATVGFGPAILLGGVLNLLHAIRPGVLIGFVVVGVGLAGWLVKWAAGFRGFRGFRSLGWVTALVLGLAVVASGVRLAATVHNPFYEPSDDLNYYFAAPEKMLALHFFAPDPYSERRITASVGGNQFLATAILATQPMESEGMADTAVGAMLLLVMAFAIAREFELTALQGGVFALLVMMMPQVRLNLTFVILPSALFLGAVYVAAERRLTEQFPALQGLALGGVVGAIASMKSNYITHGVIFVLCLAGLRGWKRGGRAGGVLLGYAVVGCLVTMLPWMIASKAASGTWFYPLLGKGLHFSAYGQYPAPMNFDVRILLHKVLPFNLPILAMLLVELWLCERDERSLTATALTLAAFLASSLMGAATGGDSLRRYNFPCVLPAVVLLFVVCARRANLSGRGGRWITAQVVAAGMIAAVAVNVGLSKFTREYEVIPLSIRASLVDFRLTNAALRDEYAAMQRSIPQDGGVLSTLRTPFLLDFSKRDILLADFPGDASPKPGWPARQSGDTLAQFLLEHGVRYLAYSYGECRLEAPFRTCQEMFEAEDMKILHDPATTALIRGEVESGHDARQQYMELAKTRRHVYDDGKIFVLDLRRQS